MGQACSAASCVIDILWTYQTLIVSTFPSSLPSIYRPSLLVGQGDIVHFTFLEFNIKSLGCTCHYVPHVAIVQKFLSDLKSAFYTRWQHGLGFAGQVIASRESSTK